MGLDITAYSHLKYAEDQTSERDYDDDDWVRVFAYALFTRSTCGLENHDKVTNKNGIDWIADGIYETTDKTERHYFRAGSYSGYGLRRQIISEMAGITSTHDYETLDDWADANADRPFFEFVWFADNEGCIGPIAAAELLTDFRAHRQDIIAALPTHDAVPGFNERWVDHWIRAFELASQDGLVEFH